MFEYVKEVRANKQLVKQLVKHVRSYEYVKAVRAMKPLLAPMLTSCRHALLAADTHAFPLLSLC